MMWLSLLEVSKKWKEECCDNTLSFVVEILFLQVMLLLSTIMGNQN